MSFWAWMENGSGPRPSLYEGVAREALVSVRSQLIGLVATTLLLACGGGTTTPTGSSGVKPQGSGPSTSGGSSGGTAGTTTGGTTGSGTTGSTTGSGSTGGVSCVGDFSLGTTFVKGEDYFAACDKAPPPTNCIGSAWVTFAGNCFCAIPCSSFENVKPGDACDSAGNYVCSRIQATNAGGNSATWCVAKAWNLCAADGTPATSGGSSGGTTGSGSTSGTTGFGEIEI